MRAGGLVFAVMLVARLPAADPAEVRIRSGPYAFPHATIAVQANLVEGGVTVRDRRGAAVGGLTAGDFEIFDSGKPQRITVFLEQRSGPAAAAKAAPGTGAPVESAGPPAGAPPAPRSLALFFDDTHASRFDCRKSVEAAEKVLAEAQPMDRIALFTGSGSVTEDFTTDREKLRAALARIKPHWTRNQLDSCVTMDPYQAYSIANYLDLFEKHRAVALAIGCNCQDGNPECVKVQPAWVQDAAENSWNMYKAGSQLVLEVLRIAVKRLAAMPESRILVILSRGFVTGGMDGQKDSIVNDALRAHIILNALNTEGLSASLARNLMLRQTVLEEMMAGVSSATGGRFIKNSNELTGALETLSKPPEVSYLLGFVPTREPDDKYHALKIRLKNDHGYEVDARQGYWAEKVKPAAETAQRRIDDAVLSTRDITEIPATLLVKVPAPKSRGAIVARVSVDPRPLRFLKKSGRSMQELTFVMVLENAAGEYLAGKQAVMDLALTPAKLASMQATGIKAVMSFPAAPGEYSLRAVVREAGQNRIAAATARFEIR
ncbi:MAG TPA: VWA domain-containing protein [Bryobacteraceae bacterium]|nr:VWA domain-containing protein [Bryobacteraceae bacterium]